MSTEMRRRFYSNQVDRTPKRDVLCSSILDRGEYPIQTSDSVFFNAFKGFAYADFLNLDNKFNLIKGKYYGGIMGYKVSENAGNLILRDINNNKNIATTPDELNGYIQQISNFGGSVSDIFIFCIIGEKFELDENSNLAIIHGAFLPITEW